MTDSRVAIVTGGGTGIGAATARQLSAAGQATRLVPAGRPGEPEAVAEAAA
ncbi:hypothetical protein [Streptomyces sp. Je 1-332]|uniref:hypothetical protein n=1 Tax=Streptomyces sp. Je 1-332 TaxID=3231270 RepID=UPI003458FA01